MLATFIIGLREGLEAALIVGIIAAFLRNNGRGLGAMWLGVGIAVALSLAVGIGLNIVEKSLPQAAQEGMETVIGGIAVFFVTGMIFWMNKHARSMKQELESQAQAALSHSGALALAIMAFLAVLKEGFETAVFLLAVFSAAQSALLAGIGAVLGVILAIVIGWGIYAGGVRINLKRFFQATGAFLILVAAGLVLSALRTAHEAGWLNGGQQTTVNLSWAVTPGTVQSALITGLLGIPADPRLIELIGWFAYLVPVMLMVYWPHQRRFSPAGIVRLRLCLGAFILALACGLALLYPEPKPNLAGMAPLSNGAAATLQGADLELVTSNGAHTQLALPAGQSQPEDRDGVTAQAWHLTSSFHPETAPSTLTLDQLVALSGGRVPVGINAALHPGPYQAAWTVQTATHVWVAHDTLLDATQEAATILTLTGSGLLSPRVISAGGTPYTAQQSWTVSPAYVSRIAATLSALPGLMQERTLWAVQLPAFLAAAGLLLIASALRRQAAGRKK